MEAPKEDYPSPSVLPKRWGHGLGVIFFSEYSMSGIVMYQMHAMSRGM